MPSLLVLWFSEERESGRGGQRRLRLANYGHYVTNKYPTCTHALRTTVAVVCACVYSKSWMERYSDEEAVYFPSPDLAAMMCESAEFISRYQWIWDVQMTKFFQLQHWNKIPSEVCTLMQCIGSRDVT